MKSPPGSDDSKVIRVCNEINIKEFKKSCKKYKCTITEAAQSLISQTLKEYAVRRGENDLNEVVITSTFFIEPTAQTVDQVKLGNGWVP